MLATAIIVFREILEIALIVGLIMAATRGLPARGLWVGIGLTIGVVLSGVLAMAADIVSAAAEGVGQEIMNAGILFAAVALLGWHNIWMRKHGKELAAHIKNVGQSISDGDRPLYILAIVAGLATLREGAEIILFLSGILASGSSVSVVISGGLAGLATGAGIGAILYFGLLRIPTRHIFTVSSWLILLLAAGMSAQAAGFLIQADLLPPLGYGIWDTSHILSERSIPGQLLHTLIGYIERPSGIQILFYLGTLLMIGISMLLTARKPVRRSPAPVKTIATVFAILVITASGIAFSEKAHASHRIYSPYVEKGEFEFEVRSHYTNDVDATLDNEQKHIFELGYGVTDHWATAILGEFKRSAAGTDTRHEASAWENIIQMSEQGEYWLDYGLYLEYEKAASDSDADKVETKLLLEKPVGMLTHTANVILGREVGANRSGGTEFELAWRTRYRFMPILEPGIEVYWEAGELGNLAPANQQTLNLGPVLSGIYKTGHASKLAYEIGYLRGVTSATPRDTLKLVLEYELHY